MGIAHLCLFAQGLDLAALAEEVAAKYSRGEFAAIHAMGTDEFQKGVPLAALEGSKPQLLAMFGSFQKYAGPAKELPAAGQGMRTFAYTAVHDKATLALTITLQAGGKIAGLRIRPDSPPPAPAGGLAVVTGKFSLPATLLVPAGDGPFPAVVLVHGSGPNDKDETIARTRSFCRSLKAFNSAASPPCGTKNEPGNIPACKPTD